MSRIKLDLSVESWHSCIVPGLRVVMEDKSVANVTYGEVLEPGKPDGGSNTRKLKAFERERVLFACDTLVDYRLMTVYSQLVPDGEQKVVHLGVVKAVVTSEGWEEAKKRGWPNDSGFAKLIVDEKWYKGALHVLAQGRMRVARNAPSA